MRWWWPMVLFLAFFVLSDESLGNQDCSKDNFMCQVDECIFESWVCDQHQDCSNNKDEESCGTRGSPCQIHHYGCTNGTCIVNSKVCDGKADCSDGEDESSCGHKCFSTEFTCSNGECITGHDKRCDGKQDCTDGSDELKCDVDEKCDFVCSNGTCVSSDLICDGENDCSDGGDEVDCDAPVTCPSDEVTCPDGRCVQGYLDCFWSSSDDSATNNQEDADQQCSLGEGCVVKVIGVVFGVLTLLTILLGGGFYWQYRQKADAGESQYVQLGRQQGINSSSEAFTMDDVT